MGTQQLLLVIVVVVVLGIAVAIGITMFGDNSISANRDAITNDLAQLALRAQQFYKRPSVLGGGDGSFARLTADAPGISVLTSKPVNSNGVFSIQTAGTSTQVVLKGVGKEKADGVNPVEVWMTVTATTAIPENKH